MVQGVVFESEQMEPTKTFDLLDGGVMGRLVDYLSALIVRIGGDRCELKTLAIVGQALVFRVARAILLRVAAGPASIPAASRRSGASSAPTPARSSQTPAETSHHDWR